MSEAPGEMYLFSFFTIQSFQRWGGLGWDSLPCDRKSLFLEICFLRYCGQCKHIRSSGHQHHRHAKGAQSFKSSWDWRRPLGQELCMVCCVSFSLLSSNKLEPYTSSPPSTARATAPSELRPMLLLAFLPLTGPIWARYTSRDGGYLHFIVAAVYFLCSLYGTPPYILFSHLLGDAHLPTLFFLCQPARYFPDAGAMHLSASGAPGNTT